LSRGLGALALWAAVGCGSGVAKPACGPETFTWNDQRCGAPPPDGGAATCTEVGDGKSYVKCNADCRCPGSTSECATLGLFRGGDFSCNESVSVCFATARMDCPAGAR
jgi:hypothetical protein